MSGEQDNQDRTKTAGDARPPRRFGDHLASLALPLAVIGLGIALSIRSTGVQALVDICRAALP